MMDDFDIREERYTGVGEKDFENALRPLSFGDFSGQQKIVENLQVFVEAALHQARGKAVLQAGSVSGNQGISPFLGLTAPGFFCWR